MTHPYWYVIRTDEEKKSKNYRFSEKWPELAFATLGILKLDRNMANRKYSVRKINFRKSTGCISAPIER